MIEILNPWNLTVLILVAVATTLLVGHASTKMITSLIKRIFGIKMDEVSGDIFEKLFMYVGLGFIFIIIYSIVLSLFSLLNQIGVLLVIGLLLIVESLVVIRHRKMEKGGERSSCIGIVKGCVTSIARKPGQLFLVGLLVAAALWYSSSAFQLASYPGGDDRAYLLVTKLMIDKGTAFIAIDYPYAGPYMDHLLMAGFMTGASFFYNMLQIIGLPTTIPVIHLFLVVLYFSLTPISIFLFTKGLSRNKEFSAIVALTALFMWQSILTYWSWGGIGEAMGYFLVPILALIDYRLNENLRNSNFGFGLKPLSGTLIAKLVLLAVAMYTHLYTLFLFIFLIMIVTPLWTIRNYLRGKRTIIMDKAKIYLRIVSPYLILFAGVIVLIVGAATLLQHFGSKNAAIDRLFDFMISSPQDILTTYDQMAWTAPWLIFRNGYGLDYTLSQLARISNLFYGDWIPTFLLLYAFCVVYLLVSKNREKSFHLETRESVGLASVMVLSAICFLLFIQDSPFGWYYVPYPLARSLLAIRLYYELNVFLLYIEALPIYLVYVYVRANIGRPIGTRRKRLRNKLIRSSKLRENLKNIGALVIVMTVTASIVLPSISYSYNNYAYQRIQSIVMPDDLDAFKWIEINTPRNATFFVNLWDAGGYIYIYTGRTVLPPDALRAWSQNNQTWRDFEWALMMLRVGSITEQLIQVLKGYSVSYVYVGEKAQYDNPLFATTALIQSPHFQVAFNQGGVYVFKMNMA